MKKLVVILGPTASGKSDLAVTLARRFHGEIVSADSRQVYRGMDLGTGKITKKEMRGIPHHLLDIASPKKQISVSQYQKYAFEAIQGIHNREKLPFLVGGSPLYIYAVTDGWTIPEVKPNPQLRKQLEKLTTEELFQKLKKLDLRRSKSIEQQNKRRLIRALEIVLTTKKPVPLLEKHPLPYPVLFIGIQKSQTTLMKAVKKRLLKRIQQGMIQEVEQLHNSGISWKRLEAFGLEYRYVSLYQQHKLSRKEMIEKLQSSIQDFIRRQMTWFKKDIRIQWVTDTKDAETKVRNFLKKRRR